MNHLINTPWTRFRRYLAQAKRPRQPLTWALLCLAALTFLVNCSPPGQRLNVFIWSEYIDPAIVADFERQFRCRVSIDLYEDNESMMAKLAGGGAALYDIVVPADYAIPALVHRGLLAPLRPENIPNLANLDPRFVNLSFDPGNRYSVPYQWGTEGLYARKPKDRALEQTWGLIFDPAQQPGPFLLIDEMRTCFSAALKFKGYSLNSTNPTELIEARDLLLQAKKRSLGFEGTVGGKNRVLSKGAVLAIVTSGDAARGIKEDGETSYFVPKEGSDIWVDNLCIPAKAPHRDLAEKFIDYILDAKVGARLSNFNQFATPNKAALPYIQPTDLSNAAIYPPPETMRRLEFLHDLGEKTKLYDELWTQIKSK
jgi:spermidine/putrescine transport system substrate-binding protein